ncbi:MAG: GxxExxY protein [Methanotrichaceae archaeon]
MEGTTRDLGLGLLESVYEAVLARMLEERRLRVERQVSVAFDFNSMHFDEELRAFAPSRESESRGAREDAVLRLANRYIRQGPYRTDEPHGCSQGAQVGEEVQR